MTPEQFKAAAGFSKAQGRKPSRGRMAAPKAQERRYAKRIVRGPLEDAMALVRSMLVPKLEALAGAAPRVQDAVDDDLADIMDSIEARYFEEWTRREFSKVARPVGTEVAVFQKAQLNKRLSQMLGQELAVDVVGAEPWLAPALDAWVRDNVALIKSIPTDFFAQLETTLSREIVAGTRWEDLAADIEERYGVAESRAELIARDQVGKLNGQLNEERQTQLGIERFTWRTVNDERVRDEHAARDGQSYDWNDPPDGEVPGEPIQCVPDTALVNSDSRILRLYRRSFRGHLTQLVSSDGEILSTTPNHPVLTSAGWKPAQLIEIGDQLVKRSNECRERFVVNQNDAQTTAIELFNTFDLLCGSRLRDTSTAGFHGEGPCEDVNIIDIDRGLGLERPTAFYELGAQNVLARAYQPGFCLGPAALCFGRNAASSNRSVGGACQLLAFLLGHEGVTDEHCLASRAGLDALAHYLGANGRTTDRKTIRQLLDTSPLNPELSQKVAVIVFGIVRRAVMQASSLMPKIPQSLAKGVSVAGQLCGRFSDGSSSEHQLVSVIEKRSSEFFEGHVVNLETESERFLAQGFVIHNCRCWADPDIESAQ